MFPGAYWLHIGFLILETLSILGQMIPVAVGEGAIQWIRKCSRFVASTHYSLVAVTQKSLQTLPKVTLVAKLPLSERITGHKNKYIHK